MREVAANLVCEGEDWTPREVIHARLGLRWRVQEVQRAWRHPGWPGQTYGKPVVERRYQLLVRGPLPGEPGRHGIFAMTATGYGDRGGFWIKPGRPGARLVRTGRRPRTAPGQGSAAREVVLTARR